MSGMGSRGNVPQYGAITEEVERRTVQTKVFGKVAVSMVLLCGAVASVGMFYLGQTASMATTFNLAAKVCPQGQHSDDGVCTDCAPGTFMDEQGDFTECKKCLPGTYTDVGGTIACKDCEPGTAEGSTGSKVCDDCEAGTYQLNTGQSSCSDCGTGRFQASEGTTKCKPCGSGTVQPEEGQTTCNSCELGKVQKFPGKNLCLECIHGKYAKSEGMTACTDCVAGKVQRGQGMSECDECDAGQYQAKTAQYDCHDCASGKVQPEEGQTACDKCNTGEVQPNTGETTCITCEPGTYGPIEAGTTCEDCLPGEVQPDAGASQCLFCPAGKVQPSGAETTCQACPLGTSQSKRGQTGCINCIPGEVQPSTGAAACNKCATGKVQPDSRQTSCISCKPGDYAPIPGMTRCSGCDYGTWLAEGGSTGCAPWTICTGSGEEGSAVRDQGVLTAGTSVNDVTCENCDRGYISLTTDSTSACIQLADSDGDGLFDRFIGAGLDYDHRLAPGTGGAYDACPFDPMDDEDGDGICGGNVPPKDQHEHLELQEYYLPGTWHVDECPLDKTNNKDKDLICDNKDKEIVTFNFYSNDLIGWDSRNSQLPFKVTSDNGVPGLQKLWFIYDGRVDDVCEKGDEYIRAVLSEESPACKYVCQDHGLECHKAGPLNNDLGHEEVCEEADLAPSGCAKAYPNRRIMCKCGVSEGDAVKTEAWSGDEYCPTCYATTGAEELGAMTTEFKIKMNTMRFSVQGSHNSPSNFVKLAIKKHDSIYGGDVHKSRDKATAGQPTFLIPVNNFLEGEWYSEELDLKDYVGEEAVLTVNHSDQVASMSIDDFQFFNSGAGCLPSCMTIEHRICNGGETCFYFEDDKIPYIMTKPTDEAGEGIYCRSGGDVGSYLGPGIESTGLLGKNGWVGSNVDSLGLDHLPRCLYIKLGVAAPVSGSDAPTPFFTISIEQDSDINWQYMPDTSIHSKGMDSGREEKGGTHCIYHTLKPRCMDYSKPTLIFAKSKATTCKANVLQPGNEISCIEQCVRMFCATETHSKHQHHPDSEQCGAKDAFDSCAVCCDSLNDNESGHSCHTRRRLEEALDEPRRATEQDSAADAADATVAVVETAAHKAKQDEMFFTEAECAEECLSTIGCLAYDTKDGSCTISDQCEEGDEADGFQTGKWMVRVGLTKADLGIKEEKKKRKKKKRSTH